VQLKRGDTHILELTSRDIVAAEAHYHTSCYKNYIRVRVQKETDADGDAMYQQIEKEGYADLFEYIRNDIIPNKQIVTVIYLTNKLESFMLSRGVTLMHDSTNSMFAEDWNLK
jgi:hypothetical protein